MRINLISRKKINNIVLLILISISLIWCFKILIYRNFDSKEVLEDKKQSKEVLEEFINYHMNKNDFKYTENTIRKIISDEDKYKKDFTRDIAREISEKNKYSFSLLEISKNDAYYVLEIPTKHPSESEGEFIFSYYFKLEKENKNWVIKKVCILCNIYNE